jgi:ABC-type methionine transport system ATPase subunit
MQNLGDLDTKNSHLIMEALIRLNRDQNITMVMVTHDRAMKSFAHRVLHMVDGKIMKIEKIPQSIRAAADDNLKDEINAAEGTRAKLEESMPETEFRDTKYYQSIHSGLVNHA